MGVHSVQLYMYGTPSPADNNPAFGRKMQHSTAVRCTGHLILQNRVQPQLPFLSSQGADLPEDVFRVDERHVRNESWMRLAWRVNNGHPLRVGVIGTSTTAGCGARSPSRLCDPGLSWARRMHESLLRMLCEISTNATGSGSSSFRLATDPKLGNGFGASAQEVAASIAPFDLQDLRAQPGLSRRSSIEKGGPKALDVRTRIFARNAVTLSFFSHCTELYVPPDTDVFVIEAFQSWFEGIETVESALDVLRRRIPRAVLLLVYWPDPHDRAVDSKTSLAVVQRLAAKHGANVLHAPKLLARANAALRGSDASQQTTSFTSSAQGALKWFAVTREGKQDHHPNAAGHHILGELAARHVATELGAAIAAPVSSLSRWGMSGAETPRLRPPTDGELCFTTAADLPVVKAGAWVLRDESGAKGVLKQGYVSTREGAEIEFGPFPSLPGHSQCGTAALFRLGYHASSTEGQGNFSITCRNGCSCLPVRGHLAASVSPFPFVRTRLDDAKYGNLSVTMNTEFMAHVLLGTEACRLVIKHLPSSVRRAAGPHAWPHGGSTFLTRVRVDSLSLRRASSMDVRNANFSRDQRYQQWVRTALCTRAR